MVLGSVNDMHLN